MADAIQRGDDGVEVELVEGSGGVFDVTAGGELIYAKSETGRFPEDGEVEALLRAR